MFDLNGKVALLTGSARGIGRETAVRLADAGADIVLNYVTSRSAAEETAEEIAARGRQVAVVRADVSEADDVAEMIGFVRDTFGRIDILVSNAATGGFRPLITTTPRNFEAAMNTNVRALIFLMQNALPLMERTEGRAKVIALSSHGSHMALPMYGLIGSTKAALESLMRHFALELGDRGINFNIVQADLVDTDSTKQFPNREQVFARARGSSLVAQRMVTTADVADAILYLASPLADMVQGHVLVVDGGSGIHL